MTALIEGRSYLIKLGTKTVSSAVTSIKFKMDANTGDELPANALRRNEIAVCEIMLSKKIPLEHIGDCRALGTLIMINRVSNMSSDCGAVRSPTSRGFPALTRCPRIRHCG